MTDEKKSKSVDYTALMQMPAWRELEYYARAEIGRSVERSDSKSSRELTIGEACEDKGFRNGIRWILRYAEQSREGV